MAAAVIEPSTVVLRLALALAFGVAVGMEREWRQKHAGLKTMTLVSLGAAAFAMMSDTFGPDNRNPAQIAAAVVGGIGFIGAGVIMHRGATVQGVTTAATLWVDASVGVAAGLGQYALATILTAAVLIVQLTLRFVELHFLASQRASSPGRFELRIECDGESLHAVNDVLAQRTELTAIRRSVHREAKRLTIHIAFRAVGSVNVAELEETLVAIDGMHSLEVRHLGNEER